VLQGGLIKSHSTNQAAHLMAVTINKSLQACDSTQQITPTRYYCNRAATGLAIGHADPGRVYNLIRLSLSVGYKNPCLLAPLQLLHVSLFSRYIPSHRP
jgi:hypothetical protein